jgi:putative membrane protein
MDLKPKSFKEWIKIALSGACMGAADIVPGISGGTIAFIMGFYDRLLRSISSFDMQAWRLLFRFQVRAFLNHVGWEFLAALITGISFSFIMLASFFQHVLGHEVYRVYLYALFMGLILASIYLCLKEIPKWTVINGITLILGTSCGILLTSARTDVMPSELLYNVHISKKVNSLPAKNFDPKTQTLLNVPESYLSAMVAKHYITLDTIVHQQKSDKVDVVFSFIHNDYSSQLNFWMIVCGIIGVTAMLLPGISGSYMLTILGAYPIVIGALADFTTGLKNGVFYREDFFVLLSVLVGILIGALVFSRVVHWLMEHYRSLTMATMIGFMLGSLPSVWPFYTYEYVVNPLKLDKGPMLQVVDPVWPPLVWEILGLAVLLGCVGFLLVIIIDKLAKTKQLIKLSK